jgi:hypothetical protein
MLEAGLVQEVHWILLRESWSGCSSVVVHDVIGHPSGLSLWLEVLSCKTAFLTFQDQA